MSLVSRPAPLRSTALTSQMLLRNSSVSAMRQNSDSARRPQARPALARQVRFLASVESQDGLLSLLRENTGLGMGQALKRSFLCHPCSPHYDSLFLAPQDVLDSPYCRDFSPTHPGTRDAPLPCAPTV